MLGLARCAVASINRRRAILFALLLAMGCVTTAGVAGREVYASNAVGVVVRQLPGNTPITRPGYLLVVESSTDEAQRTERLYHDGELVKRVVSITAGRIRTESVYTPLVLTEQHRYDSSDKLLSSATYDTDGTPIRFITYTYRRDGVVTEHRDGERALLFRERRIVDQNNRIVEILRTYEDGQIEEAQFTFLNRQLIREAHRVNELQLDITYDRYGRLVREEHRLMDELIREIDYTYAARADDRIANTVSTIRREEEGGEEVVIREQQTNNPRGQPTERIVYEDDTLVEESSFAYRDGQLYSARIYRTGSTSQRELIYNTDGEQVEERWYENGQLLRSVSTAEDEEVETRYANGRPYVRVQFKNGIRIKEEFLQDDEITRERVLE